MQTILQDLRYALRQLRKSPGFAGLAMLTLALGIGANTAMFTVVESVMLRPLPYLNSSRMVYIGPADQEGFASTSWVTYRDVRNQAQKLENVALFSEDVGVVQGKEGSMSVVTPGVTPNVFTLLGVAPRLGRTFTEDEGQPGGPQVVLLSEGLWRQAFNADQEIVGKTIRVNGQAKNCCGRNAARAFAFPKQWAQDLHKGLWLPIQATTEMLKDRGSHFFYIVAGLKPDVSYGAGPGRTGCHRASTFSRSTPKKGKDIAFRIASYHDRMTGQVRDVFLALVIALGLVLLIACGNVANLLIARCLGRQQEFAVRAALGAGQLRLVRQLFVEGGLLSVLGCLVGFRPGVDCRSRRSTNSLQDTIPRGDDIAVHWPVVLALARIATLTTVLSSLAACASLLPGLILSQLCSQLRAALGRRSVRRARQRLAGGG